jgi:hypothetical protein
MKNRKKDLIKTLSDTCLSMLESNLNLLDQPGVLLNHQRKYIASFKMSTDNQELVYDVTPVIDMIRFEGKELLVKMLRSIHHDYSVMNVQEMTSALNRHEQSISTYSEDVPNQHYIIKALAHSIEGINPINQ